MFFVNIHRPIVLFISSRFFAFLSISSSVFISAEYGKLAFRFEEFPYKRSQHFDVVVRNSFQHFTRTSNMEKRSTQYINRGRKRTTYSSTTMKNTSMISFGKDAIDNFPPMALADRIPCRRGGAACTFTDVHRHNRCARMRLCVSMLSLFLVTINS